MLAEHLTSDYCVSASVPLAQISDLNYAGCWNVGITYYAKSAVN